MMSFVEGPSQWMNRGSLRGGIFDYRLSFMRENQTWRQLGAIWMAPTGFQRTRTWETVGLEIIFGKMSQRIAFHKKSHHCIDGIESPLFDVPYVCVSLVKCSLIGSFNVSWSCDCWKVGTRRAQVKFIYAKLLTFKQDHMNEQEKPIIPCIKFDTPPLNSNRSVSNLDPNFDFISDVLTLILVNSWRHLSDE